MQGNHCTHCDFSVEMCWTWVEIPQRSWFQDDWFWTYRWYWNSSTYSYFAWRLPEAGQLKSQAYLLPSKRAWLLPWQSLGTDWEASSCQPWWLWKAEEAQRRDPGYLWIRSDSWSWLQIGNQSWSRPPNHLPSSECSSTQITVRPCWEVRRRVWQVLSRQFKRRQAGQRRRSSQTCEQYHGPQVRGRTMRSVSHLKRQRLSSSKLKQEIKRIVVY